MHIHITFTFPNGTSGDPVVSNSTAEIDTVESTDNSISWVPLSGDGSDLSALGLRIDDVKFYDPVRDPQKRIPLSTSFLNYPATKGSDGSFTFTFNERELAEEIDLSYEIFFTDTALNGVEESWDPTIKIKPRGGTAPPPSDAGAGG